MPIKIRCPAGHSLAVPERYAGKRVRCPACGASARVPGAAKRSQIIAARNEAREKPEPPRPLPQAQPPERSIPSEIPTPPPVPVPRHSPPPSTPIQTRPTRRTDLPERPSDGSPNLVTAAVLPVESVTERHRRRTPDRDDTHRYTAWQLAGFLVVMAMMTIAPVITHVAAADAWNVLFRLPAWCYVLLTLAVVHVSHAILLAQVPRWNTVWAVAQCCLLASALYGSGLALGLFGGMSNQVLDVMELIDHRLSGNLARWCLVQVCLWTVMTYAMGRTGLRWRRIARRVCSV